MLVEKILEYYIEWGKKNVEFSIIKMPFSQISIGRPE